MEDLTAAKPDQLELARGWITEFGDPIHETPDITDLKGVHLPSFGFQHGPATLAIVSIRGSLSVNALVGFLPEMKRAIAGLPPGLQFRMLEALKTSYMECPRVAWTIFPQTANRMGDVDRIQLSQVVRISDSDSAAFNRLVDAIQELTTLYVRTTQVVSGFIASDVTPGGRGRDPAGYS